MSDETVEQGALESVPPVNAAGAEPRQPRTWLLPVGIGVAGVVLASLTGAAGYARGSERGDVGETMTMLAENGEQPMQGPGDMKGFGRDDESGERGGHGPGHKDGREDRSKGDRQGRGGDGRGGHMGDHPGDFDMDGGFGPGQRMNAPGA